MNGIPEQYHSSVTRNLTMNKTHPLQLLTIDDVAELHQVSSKTVRRWTKAGELPAAKLGGQWRVHPDDLKRFFVERLYR